MPISIGVKSWKFYKRCDRRKKKNIQLEIPEVNHKEIVHRACAIFRFGMISKDEYLTIVEADLKCRGSTADSLATHQGSFNFDPITLEELGELKHTFVTPSGSCIHYNLHSFVQYLSATRDFIDPVTRLPLEIDDLMRINQKVVDAGLHLPNVVELYQKRDEIQDNAPTNVVDVRSVEACLGELITDMLKIIEKRKSSSDDNEYRLLVIFSEFETPFQEFKTLNLEAAYQALSSWISFLKGPPKKPTRDPSALLSQTISYLEGQWTEIDSEKLRMIRGGSTLPISL